MLLAAEALVQEAACAENPHQDLKCHAQFLLCVAGLQKK
jgi:hypothetical protein